jgi:hypothetical protein
VSAAAVVLDAFPTVMVAEMVKDRLAVEGIDAFVADENMGSLYPGMEAFLGGIRVLVRPEDLERARDVLAHLSQPLGTSPEGLSEEELAVLASEAEAAPPEPPAGEEAQDRVRPVFLTILVTLLLVGLAWLVFRRLGPF